MRAIFRIINIGYWKSVFGPAITFIFPILYVWIVSATFFIKPMGNVAISLSTLVLPNAFLLAPTVIMLVMFPQALYELNDSVLMKFLKATSIRKTTVLFTSFLYYAVLALISYFIGALMNPWIGMSADLRAAMQQIFYDANWGSVFYTIFIHIILSGSIAMFVVSVAKKPIVVPLVGFSIVIASLVLAGFILPIELSSWSNHPLWTLTYFDPLRYSSFLSFESWFGKASEFNTYQSSIFDVSTPYMARVVSQLAIPVTILSVPDKIANIFAPFAFTISFTSAALLLYKI